MPTESSRERLTMRDHLMFLVVMSLGSSFPLIPASGRPRFNASQETIGERRNNPPKARPACA